MGRLLDTCGRRRVRSLLLLYLFVMKAAADCPVPQGRGNIVLTNEALLLNHFPEGLNVTLECADGYVRESGSGIIICVNSNWTELDLSCKKKDCGPPNPQPNMKFNTSAGTLFGASARVICDKGYRIRGTSYKQCLRTGMWQGKAKCEIVTCDQPGNVTNGKNSWNSQDNPKYGEIIHYTCNEGYGLVGNAIIMCKETGHYNSLLPVCEGVTTVMTTVMVTPTSTLPAQEASTSTDSPTLSTTHRAVRTSATPATHTPSMQGGKDISTAKSKATTTSVTTMTSSSGQGMQGGDVDTNKDIGHIPVIISVICISLAVFIATLFLYKFLLRRKGSYDTREDLKPELLQFQNL